MSVLSLPQEAQTRRRLAEPPTAACTAPEVHCVCRQGDPSTAGMKTKKKQKKKSNPFNDFSLSRSLLSIFRFCPFQTLSWLKDNVSTATQVCSIANREGLEVARRCQYALEQEILNNKARIEVVKRVSQDIHHIPFLLKKY